MLAFCLTVGAVALVLFLIIWLPLMVVLGLAPWFLGMAGLVLLVKALLDKPFRWENLIPAGVAFLASGLLRWLF